MSAAPRRSEAEQRERIPTTLHASADAACRVVADEIVSLIRSNDEAGKATVLGLATGSTPVRLYRQLIGLYRAGAVSFRNVVTFNLDEYHGLRREHPESYWRFMHDQLFAHIDITPENTHVPDGAVARSDAFAFCQHYEEQIDAAGGIDFQVLGIGRTGHIGFNEPGSSRDSRTRLVTLDALTRRDAARDFRGEANVPRYAITMGVGTILRARRIVLLAWGGAKASVVAKAVEEPPSEALPASLLQGHAGIHCHLDLGAAAELTRCRRPWLVGPVNWEPTVTRRAVTWLSQTLRKPVLKLLDEDYTEHGMSDLLTEQGPAYGLNIRIFNELQHTITGWPGGKPGAADEHRPERALPFPKRVLVLAQEPSDDVLGMGGTLRRLVEQGHEVHAAYLTSGNLAVPDEEALMATELVAEITKDQNASDAVSHFTQTVARQLAEKTRFGADSAETRRLKGLIRRGEARAALRACGVREERIRFLDLPFYEAGRYRQFQPNEDDVSLVQRLLRRTQPHQIFTTGEGSDPTSLAALGFDLFQRAFAACAAEDWARQCRVWLYASRDRTPELAQIGMAVPLSPIELTHKAVASYHHKSQRSQSPATSSQAEGWFQAANENRQLARDYDDLGLANYEAIEPFTRWPEPRS